jgi:hypothetical protein
MALKPYIKEKQQMGTTSDFVKLRSSKTPKVGEWNIDYKTALAKAKGEYKFIVTAWSNGDACGYCVNAEKCMLTATFKNWLAKQDAYFVFQYSGDKDKGKTLNEWIYNKDTKLKYYPGFRVSLYDKNGKMVFDQAIEGNKLRNSKTGAKGAEAMIENLEKMFAQKPQKEDTEPTPAPTQEYKVRFNEKLTVKKVNAILDAIDKNDGYCPCQPKGDGTKCHCEDFKDNRGIGEPCICNLYVKVAK